MKTRSKENIAKAVTGTAGVHFVAYRLSAMGYIVALTPEGAPGVDLMAFSPKSGAVPVQVKTATDARRPGNKRIWRLSRNAPDLRSKGVFYAFVDMKGSAADKPDVFIVPAKWVADPKHRNVPNGVRALGSVNAFPKHGEPSDFWFNLYSKGQEEWAEKWELFGKTQ